MDNYCLIKKINNTKKNKNLSHKKNKNLSSKKYLLTTSFFYLEKSYKSSYKYINGLKKLIKFIDSNKEYYLRIYFDSSIFLNINYKILYTNLKSNNKVELFQYTCLDFIKKSPFHIGTFGTLLRFLPLFEKSHYDIIYVTDIDLDNYDYIKFYIDKISKKNKHFFFIYKKDYEKRYLKKFNNKFSNTVFANVFVKNYRFDMKIFTDFLNLLMSSNKLFLEIGSINNEYKPFNNVNSEIKQTYGVDEYFLNICLINRLNSKDISWITESLYFDYFFNNLTINSDDYLDIKKKYLLDIINILDINPIYNSMSYNELKKNIMNMINIQSTININLKKKFFLNYFKFIKMYKKITLDYYNKFHFIMNNKYMKEFIENDFKTISWYFVKNFDLIPKNIVSKLELNFITIK
jgi:hypothetical protein